MARPTLPRYPIYIPSRGRFKGCLTPAFLMKDEVPFRLVVEKEERGEYAARFGADRLLVLPESGQGLIFARNWIKDHATKEGHKRHWQLDDNIRHVDRNLRGRRIQMSAGVAFAASEDFVDRYENIAIAGLNYVMFAPPGSMKQPFFINCRVYSCSLVLNSLPNRWRLKYNDDVDMCLQVLADGWCTVLINAFLIQKITTMKIKGGNTPDYVNNDGRLQMARMAERQWPGVITTKRRFKRPQHVVKNAWRNFRTPLKLKPGINLSKMKPNEYGMKLVQVKPQIKSEALRSLLTTP